MSERPSGTPAPYPWGLAELLDRRPELAGVGITPMLLEHAAGAA